MPIRINLKELFPSDSQEVHVDKTNYNFNKLLELGIGERGLRGLLGGIGGAGPIGIDGDQGPRGATWFVDAGTDPNLLTFPIDLIDGDMYLDSTNLAIWQYDGVSWQFVADISNIINNYLQASPSPFIRGFGVGSPDDDRYIMFNNRDQIDNVLGIAGPRVENDILLLNNWDEDTIANFLVPPSLGGAYPNTDDFFNSILALSVDHSTVSTGRYHLELGVLYEDGANVELTTVLENFKGKFFKNAGSVHPGQDFATEMEFSLDLPPGIGTRELNGLFKFITPKYLSATSESATTYIGSRYGIDELAGSSEDTLTDGIAFLGSSALGTIGLSIENELNGGNFPADNGYVQYSINNIHLMLDNIANIESIFLNDEIWQDGGNIIQLGTSEPREKDIIEPRYGTPANFKGHAGIAVIGTELYTVAGDPDIKTGAPADLNAFGYFNRYSIDDPTKLVSKYEQSYNYSKFSGKTRDNLVTTNQCYGDYSDNSPVGPGASDVTSFGEYLCVVNTQQRALTDDSRATVNVPPFTDIYDLTYFQILKTHTANAYGLERVGSIRWNGDGGEPPTYLTSAYRVEMFGGYAVVGTSNIYGFASAADAYEMLGDEYEGRIVAVDVSDVNNPEVASFLDIPTTLSSGDLPKTAVMDMDITGDKIVALVWEQGTDPTNPTNDLKIDVKVFTQYGSIGGLFSDEVGLYDLTHDGNSDTTLLTTNLDASDMYNLVQRRGAICANRERVFAGYTNKINVYSLISTSGTKAGTPCKFTYPQETSDSTSLPSDHDIFDMKILGNSLYVLSIDNRNNFTYISKFDITNRDNSANDLDIIWTKNLQDPTGGTSIKGDRFVIVGKHIYVATSKFFGSSDTNIPSLVAIDFDGFYTGAAHIESLRADSLNVTKSADFGGEVKIHNGLTVGSELGIGGSLSVAKDIRAPKMSHVKATRGSSTLPIAPPGYSEDIIWDTVEYDSNDEYNDSTGEFTATYSGYYHISAYSHGQCLDPAGTYVMTLYVNYPDPAISYRAMEAGDFSAGQLLKTFELNETVYLEAGDVVLLRAGMSASVSDINYSGGITIDRII